MGFGTLFIGYFLILNIAFFAYTDLLAALIIYMGAYKLSSVSKSFKRLSYAALSFAAVGLYELLSVFLSMLSINILPETAVGIIGIIRYIILGAISFLTAFGILELAKEVELPRLAEKAGKIKLLSPLIFLLLALFEIPGLDSFISPKALAIIGVILLLSSFIVTVISLTAIYTSYMQICMPEDLLKEEKDSKNGFFSKIHEREIERGREYAEYKINKTKKGKK